MKRTLFSIFSGLAAVFLALSSPAQDFTFDDFVGTWHGTISATTFGGYNDPITMTIEPDGYYTETSGHLMPGLYPETQECEYDASTNRFHWWYLDLVYSGQYFYQHFYYEIVYFSNDTLEMHYNFWDDPEPWPDAGIIYLVREDLIPAPSALGYELYGSDIMLAWEQPTNWDGSLAYPDSYMLYYKQGEGDFELLDNVDETGFTHEGVTAAGEHRYYVTAVYDEGESDPSNELMIELLVPAPDGLEAQSSGNSVDLSWNIPSSTAGPMAGLLGYNVYTAPEGGTFELIGYVETTEFTHADLPAGEYAYYVTALYDGAESEPSNEVMVELIISGIEDDLAGQFSLYPNPASDVVYIHSEENIGSLQIFSPSGQVMATRAISTKLSKVDISWLDPGLYFFRFIAAEKEITSEKVFVQ
jgi:hypothetical protein